MWNGINNKFSTCFYGKGQWLVIFIALISTALSGLISMWSSAGLRYLLNGQVGITITEQDHANILNTFFVSKILGVFLVSYSMDRFGRKWTQTTFSVLALLGWLLLYVKTSAIWLYISRIFSGVFISVHMSLIPIVIGETIEPKLRGAMSSLCVFSSSVTVFLASFCVDLDYVWFNAITGPPCLILMVFSLFMVETPYYFLLKGDKEKARESILWLRGHYSDDDLNSMQEHCVPIRKSKFFLIDKGSLKPFLIAISILIATSVGSADIFFNFFFILVPSDPIPVETSYSIFLFFAFTSLIISMFLLERFGRRSSVILSCLGSCMSSVALAVWHFHPSILLGWFPAVGNWLHVFFYCLALESLPSLMLSELFSMRVKAAASVVVTTTKVVVIIIVNQSFYPIRNNLGQWVYFAISAIFLAMAAILTYFILPETKGKTLEHIQDCLTSRDNEENNKHDKANARPSTRL